MSRQVNAKMVRLTASKNTIQIAVDLVEVIKQDRPHMAAKFLKLLPYSGEMTRQWSEDVAKDKTHVWSLRLSSGIGQYVGLLWFDIKEPGIGGIDVLWIHPEYRKYGLGSMLVQGVILRYPEIRTWTAFASQATKDTGLVQFWRKNGFSELNHEQCRSSNSSLDGFFVRTEITGSNCRLAKRRIAKPQQHSISLEKSDECLLEMLSNYRTGVLAFEKDCNGGCLVPVGEEEIWKSVVPSILENYRPKRGFENEFKWWKGFLRDAPYLVLKQNGVFAGTDLIARGESDLEIQVLAGFRIDFVLNVASDAEIIASHERSKYSLVVTGGDAARIRSTGDSDKRVNTVYELIGVWLPNSKDKQKRLVLFYLALQKSGISIKTGEELVAG
jgi:GNAT superfamily N-acetyltransferase